MYRNMRGTRPNKNGSLVINLSLIERLVGDIFEVGPLY